MTFASKMMQISTIDDLRKKSVFVTFFKYNMYPVNENILGIFPFIYLNCTSYTLYMRFY